ncbi:MAG: ABC transporter substrate-binding protein [Paludibacteraceae bacterium]|nr:ABC transporter substrate-binding protein [Paludibacteraceae bacterium]
MCRRYIIVVLVLAACMIGCNHQQVANVDNDEPQYFRLMDSADCRIAEVLDPWHGGKVLARYTIERPLTRIAVTSATHIGCLKELGRMDVIVAMTNPNLLYNVPEQAVADIGEDIHINIEQLILSQPEAVFVTSYGQEMANMERIRQAGIEVIEMVEWMEQSPIARAQWLRFVAAFIGETDKADSILEAMTENYYRLAELRKTPMKPAENVTIMSGASFRGTWYVPSGSTFMGRLFRDAGARYVFDKETTIGSIPLTTEKALQSFADADVWVGCNAKDMAELKALDEKHTWLQSYQNRRVYSFYKSQNATGGNDFWETGFVHPDYILFDLIWAMYPERLADYQPHFIQHLE